MNLNGIKNLLDTASALLKNEKVETTQFYGATNRFGKNSGDAAKSAPLCDTGGLDAATRQLVEFRQNRFLKQPAAVQKSPLEAKAGDEDYTPKSVIFPLKDGRQTATRQELTRRTVQAALEQNGVHPSNLEMEEMLSLPFYQDLDMNGRYTDNFQKYQDLPGLMPSAGKFKDIGGHEVFGYKMTFSPQFQAGVIRDYRGVRGELSKPENVNRKAVIEMTMSEKYNEMLKTVWDKGYISEELMKQYHASTLTEFIAAFGIGGAVGLAAGTAASGAIAPVSGFMLAVYTAKKMTEISIISQHCREATNRQGFDKPAREFAELIGAMVKDGALAATGAAGGFAAPRLMPPLTQATENAIVQVLNGGRQIAASIPRLGEPVLATPNGAPAEVSNIRVPKGRTGLENNEPLKIVTVDEQGRASGTRFRDDYESHIKERDFSKASNKDGVSGAHNLDELEQYAIKTGTAQTKESINIISKTPHPSVKGIYKIEYQMPKLDKTGQTTGLWRNKSGADLFEKTVYDPKVISDKQMAQWGREAFAEAQSSGRIGSREWTGYTQSGIKIHGYLDDKGTNAVRSFFVEF